MDAKLLIIRLWINWS